MDPVTSFVASSAVAGVILGFLVAVFW